MVKIGIHIRLSVVLTGDYIMQLRSLLRSCHTADMRDVSTNRCLSDETAKLEAPFHTTL